MKNRIITAVSTAASAAIQFFGLGAGSTWPGHIALGWNPHFIAQTLADHPHVKVIVVAGTNGKTTSAKLLAFLLEKKGFTVFQNEEGANLLNGIASTLIRHKSLLTQKNAVAVLEVDENVLPLVLKEISPTAIILLNLFRDQLDRYGEVNLIADKWLESLRAVQGGSSLIVNGDDPQLSFIGQQVAPVMPVSRFGIDTTAMKLHELSQDGDFVSCPSCGTLLTYAAISYSHLGIFECDSCGFSHETTRTFIDDHLLYPLAGVYARYNVHAVLLTLQTVWNIPAADVKKYLHEFTPAFGRQEEVSYKGRNIFLQLSKNPAGFNQSIAVAEEIIQKKGGTILVVLNDRIPDGRDVSWIWDVEFERLLPRIKTVYVAGDRVYDMAVRLKYAGFSEILPSQNLKEAVDAAVNSIAEGESLVVLPTYSAMLEVRHIITGRTLL